MSVLGTEAHVTDADLDLIGDALQELYIRHESRRDEIREMCLRTGVLMTWDDA
jgi:hypothetical protein